MYDTAYSWDERGGGTMLVYCESHFIIQHNITFFQAVGVHVGGGELIYSNNIYLLQLRDILANILIYLLVV